jgi:outer membrane lipoprotein SlyB
MAESFSFDELSVSAGGVLGGVRGRYEGRIGRGRGGKMEAWVEAVLGPLWKEGSVRGDEGEYHH